MYHTPGTELRLVFCDLPKSRIFRISGSRKSRKSPICPAKPVPIDSARRDEAIHVSHARNRAATGFSGFPEAVNPGNRRSARRNRYQSTQLVETKRFMYHTPGTELRLVFCDLPKSRIFRISGSRFSGFPEAVNPGNRRSARRNRYQSTQLVETKRFMYHTPGTELRLVFCDLPKSRIFRISGSPRRDEAIHYHTPGTELRLVFCDLPKSGFSGFPEAVNPGNRRSARRNRYQSTQLVETKRFIITRPEPSCDWCSVTCPNPGFSGFPEAVNPGNRRSARRNRYQSTQLVETKRFMYHTPGTELRLVFCDLPKSRIFRISGSRFSGFPEAVNPGNRRSARRNRYQSTQLVETKRFMYHTPGTELRLVFCDLPKSRIFRISGSRKSRKSPICPAKPVPIDSARRDEAIHVSHARNRAATGVL
ncbi:hypothetical protein DdX_07328 [Ditylenchus destructor]|uniref:Uncharacterized protein n=1 Tax=Ditylenchus destructor TaxID=166010 RepID=A0AAD4N9N1_9BILA|nr:hypothetical protein DdX_07328 [Ditylenchus destructor]